MLRYSHYLLIIISIFLIQCEKNNKGKDTPLSTIVTKDSRGKKISLSKVAQRVVVLFSPLVDEIYMLGAENQLVGIPKQIYTEESTYNYLSKIDDRIKNKSIATPTFSGAGASVEMTLGLKPDLVITYEGNIDVEEQLQQHNIPVFSVSSIDKKAIFSELRNIAKLLGKSERAEKLINYVNTNLDEMQKNKSNTPKKIYYGWSRGRIFSTSGKGTLMDLAIESSGNVNACPLELHIPNISPEMLFKWNPDLIVLWNSKKEDVYSIKSLEILPAVKNRKIYELTPTFNFDPHTIKFFLFAKQINHWVNDIDKEKSENEIKKDLDFLYSKNK